MFATISISNSDPMTSGCNMGYCGLGNLSGGKTFTVNHSLVSIVGRCMYASFVCHAVASYDYMAFSVGLSTITIGAIDSFKIYLMKL